jgi:cytochrome c biogenesis factor
MERRRAFGVAAALVLVAAACIEIGLAVSGHAWTRFGTTTGDLVSAMLAVFFLTSAPLMLMRGRSESWARVAFSIAIVSTLALFMRSLIDLAGLYLPLTFLQTFFLWNAFRGIGRGIPTPRSPSRPRIRPHTPVRWA